MPDNADINLDELRRRARRRLIGAVVLAVAAAVIVPMLLESEPKPLGEDVAVKIPPVDDTKPVTRPPERAAGKAVNRADPQKSEVAVTEGPKVESPGVDIQKPESPKSETAKTDSTKGAVSAAQSGAPKMSLNDAEQKVLGGVKMPAVAAPEAASPQQQPASTAASSATENVAATAAPTATPTTVASAAKDVPAAITTAPPISKGETSSAGFSVQLAAFSDDKGANALANKLKRGAYPAYTEPLSTSKGTLWRVRVGPFSSRDSAVEARDKLKGDGYSGIVTLTK